MDIKKYLRLKVKIKEEQKKSTLFFFLLLYLYVGTGRRALFVYVSVFLFKPIFDVYNPITTMMRIETHFLFPFKKPTKRWFTYDSVWNMPSKIVLKLFS